MAEASLESADFRHKFAPWHVGFPDILARYHQPDPIHVTISNADQKRPETDADGRWRKQTEADGSSEMEETELESANSPRKFGPGPVGFPDMLSRHHHPGPQTCCHHPRGPDAARNGSRRQIAEAEGSRRHLIEAEKWHMQH